MISSGKYLKDPKSVYVSDLVDYLGSIWYNSEPLEINKKMVEQFFFGSTLNS